MEQKPILWNPSLYGNRKDREEAWVEVAVAFEGRFSLKALNIKWQSLRAQYRHNLQRKGQNLDVKWSYFASMNFLGNETVSQVSQPEQGRKQFRCRKGSHR